MGTQQGESRVILIDDRAGSKELVLYPPLDDPSIACLVQLSSTANSSKTSADITFTGNGPDGDILIGIEHKSLGDLISSMQSGRLSATQIPSMIETYDKCYLLTCDRYLLGSPSNLDDNFNNLLIPNPRLFRDKSRGNKHYWFVKSIPSHGPYETRREALEDYAYNSSRWDTYSYIGNKPLNWGFVESSLLSYSESGIIHKHLETMSDCAKWIMCLYKWWNKPYNDHKAFRTFDKSRPNKPVSKRFQPAILNKPKQSPVHTSIMEFAKCIDGIDYERAESIASHFQSVHAMVTATETEWIKIPGIGPTISRVAVETFRRTKKLTSDLETSILDHI